MAKAVYIGVETDGSSGGSTPISGLTVGSTVKLNVNGTARDFIVVHQGLPSSLYDDSCDGTWLLMKDIYEQRAWDSSDNDYANSDIHTYLNGTFLGLFDSDVRAIIKQVKIPYQNGTGNSGTVASGSNGLSTKVFLLSNCELGFTAEVLDGEKLDYFEFGDSTDAKRVASLDGSANRWWTRTPRNINAKYVWFVANAGSRSSITYTSSYGIRPALVLPSDLNLTQNDDGSYAISASGGSTGGPEVVVPDEAARKVTTMYIGIDNVARKIVKGYIGDENGIARLFWGDSKKSLNDTSWARIKEIADAQEGPSYFAIGDMKAVTLNGTVGALTLSNFTCYCFIIGFDHNSSREGTGIHFQFGKLEDGTDIMFVDSLYNQGHVSGGFRMVTGSQNYDWYSSYMRKTICPAFLKTLPSDLQAVISSCKKFQSLWIEYEDYPEDNYYSVTTSTYTTDKIWLLGWFEVYSSSSSYNYVNSSEKSYQTQYAYYAAGNSKSKYPHNNPTGTCWGWWTRSPMESGGSGFMKAGTTFTFDYADYSLGFAPGFKV